MSAAPAGFEAFVLGRSRDLLRTAHLLTGDRGHAEDLLQQALERLARNWSRVHGDPEGYVRRILVNLATDRWRARGRRVGEVLGLRHDAPVRHDDHARVEQQYDLVRALRTLPPRQRTVLVLRYFVDLPEGEVAELLGCSVGTVKSTTSRALARLREATTSSEPAGAGVPRRLA